MALNAAQSAISASQDNALRELRKIPNVGPAVAGDLFRLGMTTLDDLAACDSDDLYQTLCHIDGQRHDPCMRDVFAAVISYARGEPAQPWWAFTAARKARDKREGSLQ